jgi:predicted dehydrogenase
MLDVLAPIARACHEAVAVAPEHRKPIAVIGAGAIVESGHLPAYRLLGLEVRGLFDVRTDRARDLAARFDVPRVYDSLDEVLDDDDVEVVDVAVHPPAQPGIAERVLRSGRHVLCQKPLALDLDDARRLVALAAELDRQLVVNQQLRFDEGIAATKAMLEQGWIGTPLALRFDVDTSTDFATWPWLASVPRLEILYHSIHYLDAVRHLLGDPRAAFSVGGRHPGQRSAGETRTVSTLIFEDDLHAVVLSNHGNHWGDIHARFRLEGSDGAIRGTLGLLYDYPHGRPDTVEVHSTAVPTDGWLPYPVTRRWFPDAFAGPMASLLRAAADGPSAPSSGADNVRTLSLVEALYASMEQTQVQHDPCGVGARA